MILSVIVSASRNVTDELILQSEATVATHTNELLHLYFVVCLDGIIKAFAFT